MTNQIFRLLLINLGLSMGDAAGGFGLTGIDVDDDKGYDDDEEVRKGEKENIHRSKKKAKPRKQ
jgi:hypothetical protein